MFKSKVTKDMPLTAVTNTSTFWYLEMILFREHGTLSWAAALKEQWTTRAQACSLYEEVIICILQRGKWEESFP